MSAAPALQHQQQQQQAEYEVLAARTASKPGFRKKTWLLRGIGLSILLGEHSELKPTLAAVIGQHATSGSGCQQVGDTPHPRPPFHSTVPVATCKTNVAVVAVGNRLFRASRTEQCLPATHACCLLQCMLM
jgi:hypothetical protein